MVMVSYIFGKDFHGFLVDVGSCDVKDFEMNEISKAFRDGNKAFIGGL